MTKPITSRAAVILSVFLFSFGPLPVFPQQGETAEFLQHFPRNFSRKDLEKNISFVGEDETVKTGVRCATPSVGGFERTVIQAAIGDLMAVQGKAHRYSTITVPIVFHVAHTSDGTGKLKKKHIKRQIRVLNRAYSKHGFRFERRAIRRYLDDRFASGCLDADIESDFRRRHALDPAHTLNVYTCIPADGTLGWTYMPWGLPEDSFLHGPLVHYSTLPKGSLAPFNLGQTLTHEVGHYLGLYHTFEGACSDGDLVADTPAEQSPAFGCPSPRDTCSSPGEDPVHNFMNYSDDSCMTHFSHNQGDRMHDVVATFRPSLGF